MTVQDFSENYKGWTAPCDPHNDYIENYTYLDKERMSDFFATDNEVHLPEQGCEVAEGPDSDLPDLEHVPVSENRVVESDYDYDYSYDYSYNYKYNYKYNY
jgi:hypothetical protein